MHVIKVIGLLILSFLVSFGLWYLIFWFITAEDNLFMWSGWIKAFYLILGFTSMTGIIDETLKEL